jgi:hypothetical protein
MRSYTKTHRALLIGSLVFGMISTGAVDILGGPDTPSSCGIDSPFEPETPIKSACQIIDEGDPFGPVGYVSQPVATNDHPPEFPTASATVHNTRDVWLVLFRYERDIYWRVLFHLIGFPSVK